MSSATADDIRRAALRLFAQGGYEATTMREIAAEVGIRAASLYNHFGSKEDILWDLTSTALDELQAESEASMSLLPHNAKPIEQLRSFVRAHIAYHAVNSEQATLVNMQMGGLTKSHHRKSVTLRDRYEARLRQIMQDGVATGEFDVPDERVTSFAILQMGIAVAGWYRPEGNLSVPQLCDVYETLASRMVTA
jgi:AcrR family transcriptional regulator